MATSWRTTSAMRRSRTLPAAVSIAFFAASAKESGLVPITSVTRYTLPATASPSGSGRRDPLTLGQTAGTIRDLPTIRWAIQDPSGSSEGLHIHSAVDGEHLARDVARRVRAQEVHQPRDLVRPSHPPQRDLLLDRLHDLLRQVFRHVGLDDPGRHAVAGPPHAVLVQLPLLGQRLRGLAG